MEQPNPKNNFPFPVVLFFNFAIASGPAVFGFVIIPALSPCVSPTVRAASQTVILLLFLHLVWRYFHSHVKGVGDAIKFGGIAIPIKVLAAVFDELHPWRLSNRSLWGLAFGLGLVAWGLGLSAFSPFPLPEAVPVIQNFSVRYPDGATQTAMPGGEIQVADGQRVIVEAAVLHAENPRCEWSAIKGASLPEPRCSTQYRAPLEGDLDSLTVRIQSQCKTQSTYGSLHIKITP